MVVMGAYLLNQNGICGKALFPLVSVAIWTLLYWILVLSIKSKRVKKTFALRFLVNGTVGVLISSLMWIFFAGWNLMADSPFLHFHAFVWMIPIYLLVSAVYIAGVVIGTHQGVYARRKLKTKPIVFASASVSLAAFFGLIVSGILSETATLKIQHIVMTIGSIILIFVPVLAHINFLQYFYCKKYNITCDENGDAASQDLYPTDHRNMESNPQQDRETNRRSLTKVLRILLFMLAAAFAIFCIISFTKGFIRGIS